MKKGFTLIVLIVWVAIIVLVASILLPAVKRARDLNIKTNVLKDSKVVGGSNNSEESSNAVPKNPVVDLANLRASSTRLTMVYYNSFQGTSVRILKDAETNNEFIIFGSDSIIQIVNK